MGKIYEALELAKRNREVDKPHLDVAPSVNDASPPTPVADRQSPIHLDLEVIKDPDSIMSECFRFLRSKITRPANGIPTRSILVTSAIAGEGKSFVASNVAAAIGQGLEEYALLIDADLRKPTLHNRMKSPLQGEGLASFLSKNTPLASLLVKTGIDRLAFLPAGSYEKNPAELLSSTKMKFFIQEVRNRYSDRFIIIDSPPVELAPETSVIANEVDGIIFVVRYGVSPRETVKSAIGRFQKEKLLGVVFNSCNENSGPYSRYGYTRYRHSKKR
jgi:protein-tyrosine kinase